MQTQKEIAIQELTETTQRLQYLLQFEVSKDTLRKEIKLAIEIIKEFGIKDLK